MNSTNYTKYIMCTWTLNHTDHTHTLDHRLNEQEHCVDLTI